MRRLGLMLAIAVLPLMAARVRVQETLYSGNGQPARGTVEISWPAFRTAAGEEVAADRITLTIWGGVIDVQLYPTEGAAPAGVAYTAKYAMAGGTKYMETWTVPVVAGPLGLQAVRATSTLTVWLGQIAQGAAALNQCLIWNGTAWAPGACAAPWGSMTGTLADQADLQAALAGKANAAHAAAHAAGQADAVTPAAIGAEAVDPNIVRKNADGSVSISTTVLPGTAIATTALTTVNLIAGNNGQQIAFTAATDVTLNITSTVAVQGFSILIIQRGAGAIIPTASGAGITIRQRESKTKTAGQYAMATLSCDIAGDCILGGDLQ